MTTHDCTANTVDFKNISYLFPLDSRSSALDIAEDTDEYEVNPSTDDALPSMHIHCETLQTYLRQQLETHKHSLPMRSHQLLDELTPLLEQHKTIDLFELLIELIFLADEEPAQDMCALLAVLDGDALSRLEEFDVSNAAAFIRDAMRHDFVRWHLQDYKTRQEKKLKQ